MQTKTMEKLQYISQGQTLTEQKNTKTAAVKNLCAPDNVNFKGYDQSSLMRELFRVYEVTKKSIAAGEILPIEDGKKKKKK